MIGILVWDQFKICRFEGDCVIEYRMFFVCIIFFKVS